MTDVLPPREAQTLAALDQAREAIELARQSGDVDTLLELRDRAAAVQHYQRRRDGAREVADSAGEIKVRAEAALGHIDWEANPPHSGGRGKTATADVVVSTQPNTRASWRALGRLAPEQLDAVVALLRTGDGGGVTTTRAMRIAREVAPGRRPHPIEVERHERRQAVDDYHDRLKVAARELQWLETNAERVAPSERQLDQWDIWLDQIAERARTARDRLDTRR
jgi:hypothetical protein